MLLKNKRGFGLVDALGAVILISIAAVTITGTMLNSVRISTNNKEKLLAQTACEYYINALQTDINVDGFDSKFDSCSAYISSNTFTASGDNGISAISSLLTNNSLTYKYYADQLLSFDNHIFNKENITIEIIKEAKGTVNFYTVNVYAQYLPTKSEVLSYEFYAI